MLISNSQSISFWVRNFDRRRDSLSESKGCFFSKFILQMGSKYSVQVKYSLIEGFLLISQSSLFF